MIRRICRALLAVAAALIPVSLAAQAPVAMSPAAEWIRPYRQLPEYWELAGRLFGDSAAINDDRNFRVITDPSVLALGQIKRQTKPGETVASLAIFTYNTDADNQFDALNPRLVIKDLMQVRVVVAGTRGIVVDVKTGTSSLPHQQCIDRRIPTLVHLLDGRWRAIAACEPTVFWSSWQREPTSGVETTFTANGLITFDFSYDRTAGVINVGVRPR